ncbi:hypothetical protein RB195_004322 [Necator americanus]|uniref:Transmembrane protein 138 n=1 Tax=Necator americanus TaxID=51031 RepID=A0ABR1BHE6_NECAM
MVGESASAREISEKTCQSTSLICEDEETNLDRLYAGLARSNYSQSPNSTFASVRRDPKELITTPVYYIFGNALFDMLVLLGVLFGTVFFTFIRLIQSTVLFAIVLGFYMLIKISCFVLGYIAIKSVNRLFFLITIGVAALGLMLVVYLLARSFTALFDSMGVQKVFEFFVSIVELLVFVHVIYYSIKLM